MDNRPIPEFSVDEIFDKAKQSDMPPFYLVYGWLVLHGYCDKGDEESPFANGRLGINAKELRFAKSDDRDRNARMLMLLEPLYEAGLLISFTGERSWMENDYMYGDEPDKFHKYINHLEPYT